MNYERREDRRRAAHYLLYYRQEREAYRDSRTQWLTRPVDENGGRRGGISRPTENMALQGVEYDIRHPVYYWLRAVEAVVGALPPKRKQFLELRRESLRARNRKERGRRAWIAYIQARLPYYVSDAAAKRWWSDIVEAVVDRQLRERLKMAERKMIVWWGLAPVVQDGGEAGT